MPNIEAGKTHHIVFHVNDSVLCGAMVKPFTYRVNTAPTFIPRIPQGSPKGYDRGRWKSFIQARFDGGAGQLYWSNLTPTNRFADSHLVDLGLTGAPGSFPLLGRQQGAVQIDEDESLRSDFAIALLPQNTTMYSQQSANLFTGGFKLSVLDMSLTPLAYQGAGAFLYTTLHDTSAWIGGGASQGGKFTGAWVVANTLGSGAYYYDAVRYSGVAVVSKGPDGLEIFGSLPSGGSPGAASTYSPSYETTAWELAVYDDKLWRTNDGRVSYLTPAVNTLDAIWSDYIDIGEAHVLINSMLPFNGKLYFGKVDGLWVYDAGTVYEVVDYHNERDPSNFALMVVYQGALYFNIRYDLYRLSTDGLLEKISTPITDGYILDGTVLGGKLYILAKAEGALPHDGTISVDPKFNRGKRRMGAHRAPTQIWVFDRETGGTSRWIDLNTIAAHLAYSPTSLAASNGLLFVSPIISTIGWTSYARASPIMMVDRLNPPSTQSHPDVADSNSWLITSAFDLGYPNIRKLFNAVQVNYGLGDPNNRIKVSYRDGDIPAISPSRVFVYSVTDNTLFNITDEVTDNDLTTRRAFNLGDGAGEYEYILMGFDQKPSSIKMHFFERILVGSERLVVEALRSYLTGGFMKSPSDLQGWYFGSEYTKTVTVSPAPYPVQMPPVSVDDPHYIVTLKMDINHERRDWPAITTKAIQEDIQWGSEISFDTDPLYYVWLRFLATGSSGQPPIDPGVARLAEVIEDTKEYNLYRVRADWTSLGEITGATDLFANRKKFTFPADTNYNSIVLRFDLVAAPWKRPIVNGFELEYLEEPSNLEVLDATLEITDNMERLDMVREHSAAFVAASVMSMAKSGLMHVVQVPWPTPHTLRAKVSISQPGVFVPFPVTNTIQGQATESEIPIRLDEM